MRMKQRAPIITAVKRKIYECDVATIAFYRRNPVIAARDLLGIQLFDAQAYMLEQSWNAEADADYDGTGAGYDDRCAACCTGQLCRKVCCQAWS